MSDEPLSPMYSLDRIVSKLTNSNNYDKDIEIFWYGFKESIKNFTKDKESYNEIILDKLGKDSAYLNSLKLEKNYDEIMQTIAYRIEEYIYLIIKNKTDRYHINILMTNVKRWHSVLESLNKKMYFISQKYMVYLNVYYKLVRKLHICDFTDILQYLDTFSIDHIKNLYDIEGMIDILIKYEITSAIDNLIEIIDISEYVNKKYNINVFRKTKGYKILYQIKNKTNQ